MYVYACYVYVLCIVVHVCTYVGRFTYVFICLRTCCSIIPLLTSIEVDGCRLAMDVSDVNGRQWMPMAVNGRQWTSMDGNRRQWPPMDGNRRQWNGVVEGMGLP